MRYLEASFSTFAVGSEDYRNNWDAIFGKKEEPDVTTPAAPQVDALPGPSVVKTKDLAQFVMEQSLLLTIEEVATALEIGGESPIPLVLKHTCGAQAKRLRDLLAGVRV